MSMIGALRPVETLYFLNEVGVDRWSIRNALISVLVYLNLHGFLNDENTLAGNELRSYEYEILKHIRRWNINAVIKVIKRYDFKNFFVYNKVFELKEIKTWFFIPSTTTIRTELGDKLYNDVFKSRWSVFNHVTNKVKMDKELIIGAYAFPEYVKKYPVIKESLCDITDTRMMDAITKVIDKKLGIKH